MTTSAETWYRELYLSKITHKYKNAGFLLKQWVQPPSEINGKTLHFPVALPGVAQKTKRGDTAKPMNAGRSDKTVTADWYEAPEEIFKIDIHKMAPSEMEAATKNASDALGQAHDLAIMSAFNAGVGSYTNPDASTVVGSGTAAWDIAKALTAENFLFRKTDSPREMAVCVLPSTAFTQMKTFQAVANSQYTGEYMLAKGVQAFTWSRTHWICGYDSMFPQAAPSGGHTDTTFYMWFPNAIGSGDTGGIQTAINYIPERRCWLHDNTIEIGATVLLPEAIVECHMDINSLPTITLTA